MQITLNAPATQKVKKLIEDYKAKKVKRVNWNNIISDFIVKTPEKSICTLADAYIPDDYFIEQALGDPESKKALMATIKKQRKLNQQKEETKGEES